MTLVIRSLEPPESRQWQNDHFQTVLFQMCVIAGNSIKNYSKRRYLDINGKVEGEEDVDDDDDEDAKDAQMMEDYRQEMLEDSDGNKIESSYVEVQDEVADLRDEDIIEHVQPDYQQSQPIGLSHDNGTIQIIVTNGTNGIPTTLADMVSRMNHPGGGQTILLQQSDDGKDVGDHQHQQHVVVTTSNEAGETIVIRNLEEHSPEMQKEILNALLQHHAETQQQQHQQHHVIETTDADGTHATLRYVIDSRHDNANVKVEAEPASGAEMSPDSLTAISGHHPETSGHVTIKSDDDMNRISVNEFLSK